MKARRHIRLLIAALVVLAVIAPWLAPFDPDTVSMVASSRGGWPSWRHPLGTDMLGRDIASRLLVGARTTLLVVGGATVISLAIALGLAMLCCRSSATGRIVSIVRGLTLRAADTLRAVPRVVLVVALGGLASGLGADPTWSLMWFLGLTGWMPLLRLLHDLLLAVRREPFVDAARAIGLTDYQLFRAHEAPAILPAVRVWLTSALAELIMLEAGLSFLGVGVAVTQPSWGSVLRDVGDVFGPARWLMLGPGVVTGGTVALLQWLADRESAEGQEHH